MIIGAVGVYAIFLLVSDLNLVYDKVVNFKIAYLPIIVGLISFSWLILFYRWHVLLKNSNINVPRKKSFLIPAQLFTSVVILTFQSQSRLS